jgi:hypothetical protein
VIAATVQVAVDRLAPGARNYSLVEDGLYLGGHVPAPPPGTSAVLNLCEVDDPYQTPVNSWNQIPDAAPAPSLAWLRERVLFVATERAAGRRVYVHCYAGVSRSALVVVAYLMARDGLSRDAALAVVRLRRPRVQPNPAFMELLLEWERWLRKARRRP